MNRVLVVGDNPMAALQTVRSLGRCGLQVDLVAFEANRITRRSRYVRRVIDLGHPLADPEQFLQRFIDLVAGEDYDLAVPTSDPSLIPLVSRYDEVNALIKLAAPRPEVFNIAHRKSLTIRLAHRVGIAVPQTVFLPEQEIDRVAELGTPVVLKPDSSLQVGRTKPRSVEVAHSEAQWRQRLPEMLADGDVLAQQYCPGFGRGLGVLADRGTVTAAFQYRRVHEPPAGGPSTYRVSERLCDELFSGVQAFCRQADWSGPAMFEYKVCPDSGRSVLMEVNGRMWGSIALAIKSGVDFPRLIYQQYARGELGQVTTYRVPHYVRNVSRDLYWLQANLRAPRGRPDIRRVPMRQVAVEWFNPLRLCESPELESVRDPLPGLIAWRDFVVELAGDIRGRLRALRDRRLAARIGRRMRQDPEDLTTRLREARSVLFVCVGNINRSAVAKQAFCNLCAGAERPPLISAAGTLERPGRSTSQLSLEVASRLGVDLSEHRSTTLNAELLRGNDVIFVMDASQLGRVRQLDPESLQRTYMLGGLDPIDASDEIPDPYGKGQEEFEATYQRLVRCIKALGDRALIHGSVNERESSLAL